MQYPCHMRVPKDMQAPRLAMYSSPERVSLAAGRLHDLCRAELDVRMYNMGCIHEHVGVYPLCAPCAGTEVCCGECWVTILADAEYITTKPSLATC